MGVFDDAMGGPQHAPIVTLYIAIDTHKGGGGVKAVSSLRCSESFVVQLHNLTGWSEILLQLANFYCVPQIIIHTATIRNAMKRS